MAVEKPVTFPGDVHIQGNLTIGGTAGVGAGEVGNAQMNPDDPIGGDKSYARQRKTYSQKNVAAVTETVVLHQAFAAGSVLGAKVTNIARATGDSTVTVMIKKNGIDLLSAAIQLDATHPASGATYGSVDGLMVAAPTTDFVEDDVITAVITATVGAGTLPTGVAITLELDEAPQ